MNSAYHSVPAGILRLSEIASSFNYRGPRPCSLAGCEQRTQEGKPFCVGHVDHNPYVRDVMAVIAAADQERALVRRRGSRAVDPEALTSREILRELRVHGACSPARLARRLGLDLELLRVYLRALARERALRLSSRGRGQVVVPLEPVPLSHASLPAARFTRGA